MLKDARRFNRIQSVFKEDTTLTFYTKDLKYSLAHESYWVDENKFAMVAWTFPKKFPRLAWFD